MSLKKPKNVPKIPKAREKSIDKLKKAIPQKKDGEIEFNIKFFFKKGKDDKQLYTIRIETVKVFAFLNYDLAAHGEKNKREIDVSILGLQTTNDYINEPKPASIDLDFEELHGEFIVNILKQDGAMNCAEVKFNVFKKEISILKELLPEKKNNRLFCKFFVADEFFSFASSK